MAQSYPPIPEQPAAPGPAPKSGMSTTTKVILGILAVLGLCCIVGVIAVTLGGAWLSRQVEQGLIEDPEQAQSIGQSIVAYDLPPGYQEEGAMNFLGVMEMVFISEGGVDTDDNMIIFLARFSIPGLSESDTEQMKQQMQEQMASGGSTQGIRFVEVDSRPITINGETTTLTIAEGESEGVLYRQAAAGFGSDGKPAMVMVMGPVDSWDEPAVEQFLASVE